MAALTDVSDRIAVMTGGNTQSCFWNKSESLNFNTTGAGFSLWTTPGVPGAAAVPTSVAACTSSTAGALAYTNPGGGRQKWLMHASMGMKRPGSITIYDRLLHIGGLSGTSTSAQTVGGTITRYTNGIGNRVIFEVYTDIGSTEVTATLAYTNDANGSVTSTIQVGAANDTIGNARRKSSFSIFPLKAGEKGVKSVTSVTLFSSTGTTGDFGITVIHPLVDLLGVSQDANLGAGQYSSIYSMQGDVEIQDNACLAFLSRSSFNSASNFRFMGMVHMGEK